MRASQHHLLLCYVAVTLTRVEVDDKHFDLGNATETDGTFGSPQHLVKAHAAVRMRDQSCWTIEAYKEREENGPVRVRKEVGSTEELDHGGLYRKRGKWSSKSKKRRREKRVRG